ncbi:hypothetical protein L580_1933 [Serratia fonticola AU-P3(3)]|nr:hypothetical protein L580_1933 [Serratia fonticola AU-P3(3)]
MSVSEVPGNGSQWSLEAATMFCAQSGIQRARRNHRWQT